MSGTLMSVSTELKDDFEWDTLDLLHDPANYAKQLELQCVPKHISMALVTHGRLALK